MSKLYGTMSKKRYAAFANAAAKRELVPSATAWPRYEEFYAHSVKSHALTVVLPTKRDNKITAELLRALADDLECKRG